MEGFQRRSAARCHCSRPAISADELARNEQLLRGIATILCLSSVLSLHIVWQVQVPKQAPLRPPPRHLQLGAYHGISVVNSAG